VETAERIAAVDKFDAATDGDRGDEAMADYLAAAIAPGSRVPLNEQLEAALSNAIREGRLTPGTVLPREPDLARRLGLSRQTVGQALKRLAQRGLLIRRPGIGTFVAAPAVEQPLGRLSSFVQTLTAGGQAASSRLMGFRLTVDPAASPLLTDRADGLVWEISRLVAADGEPFVYERIFLPEDCGERLAGVDLAQAVIYDVFRDYCGIAVTHGEEALRLAKLGRTEAALLGLPVGTPAFLVERLAYAGDRIVEVRRSLIRGDRARFRIRLEGPALTPVGSNPGGSPLGRRVPAGHDDSMSPS
jgi:GntR family transcriptional regulator